jgi:tetratricopeptide (TPR) repeat protein
MSLLNDALRKKRNETGNNGQKDVLLNPKRMASLNVRKIKVARIFLLLFLFSTLIMGGWYVLGSPFAQTDSFLAASSVTHDARLIEFNPTSESTLIASEAAKPETAPPEPLREIKPLQDLAAKEKTETVKHDPPSAKTRSEEISPPPTKQALKKPRKPKKKPHPKPADGKNRQSGKPKDKSSSSHQDSIFLRKAYHYHRQGKLGQAIQMYKQVLSVNSAHQDAMFNLASAYIQSASYSEAYPLLQNLRRQDYGNPDILVNLAIVEIGLGNPAEAIHLLDLAAKHHEGPNFKIYFHRAAALSRLGRLEEARNSYKKAQELNPSHLTTAFNLAVLCDKLQNYEEAVVYYRAFLKNSDRLSHQERKNIKARIRSLQAYLAGQGN